MLGTFPLYTTCSCSVVGYFYARQMLGETGLDTGDIAQGFCKSRCIQSDYLGTLGKELCLVLRTAGL
jgi:hypothetical protein